jgi:ubiquitin-activating enzyme E1
MTTYLGALVAQEALKGATHKYQPIQQFFFFDSLETLPNPLPQEEDCKPIDSRYDGQIAVFGSDFQDKLGNKKSFIVGAGALGCEYIKNYACMGISCGPKGKTFVTDSDTIDVSNLSRQFLFRQEHVKSFKSEVAAGAAVKMNPSLNIKSLQDRVGPETENVFNDKFWENLDFVTNALDNVQARLYTDSKCVYYRKALFESGTLGTMANSQTILPFETKTYASYKDPPQKAIAKCTLHTFPNLIQHTITWARALFEKMFATEANEASQYLAHPKEWLDANHTNLFACETVLFFLKSKPKSFEECVMKARQQFEELFIHSIQNILEQYPQDHKTEGGGAFWSGNKRCPKVPVFDFSDFTHKQFIVSATKLYCDVNGIEFTEKDDSVYVSLCQKTSLPKFAPKKVVTEKDDKKIVELDAPQLSEEEAKKKKEYTDKVMSSLADSTTFGTCKVFPVEFEKDQDDNLHMDFITAASNIRASAYGIPEADKHRTKGIAGNIIPAMITTTALITGVCGFEILKFCQGKKKEAFRNSFNNIAHNTSQFSEPGEPEKEFAGKWTVWDRFEISEGKDITLEEFLKILKDRYELTVIGLTYGGTVLFMLKPDETIIKAPLAKLVQHLSEEKFDSNRKFIELTAQCMLKGKVEAVPTVKYQFKFETEKKPVIIKKK